MKLGEILIALAHGSKLEVTTPTGEWVDLHTNDKEATLVGEIMEAMGAGAQFRTKETPVYRRITTVEECNEIRSNKGFVEFSADSRAVADINNPYVMWLDISDNFDRDDEEFERLLGYSMRTKD